MIFSFRDQNLTEEQIESQLKHYAGSEFDPKMLVVFKCGLENQDLLPRFFKKKKEIKSFEEYTNKWVKQYLKVIKVGLQSEKESPHRLYLIQLYH